MLQTSNRDDKKSSNKLTSMDLKTSIIKEMKFESQNKKNLNDFWTWFSGAAQQFGADPKKVELLGELDKRLHNLSPNVSWEVGPGIFENWQLVISPNLNRQLRDEARYIVSAAPLLPGWEFHSARQPKKWDYKFHLERKGKLMQLDARSWAFVLLVHPDGTREILLNAPSLPALTADERWQAAAIALESILGEDVLMDKVDNFELTTHLEPRFAKRQRSIQELREAVGV